MNDDILGEVKQHLDAWIGEKRWVFPGSGMEALRFRIRADERGPSAEQKQLVVELIERYESLWPKIAQKLVELNPAVKKIDELSANLKPILLLSVPGIVGTEEFDFTLGYEFTNKEKANEGYFLSFGSWEIKSALRAA